jgi:uncharacterized lipoprotein NlpE involved in copper resistance
MSAVGKVATMTYQSDVLPSTDTPGLQVTMVFGEDGSIQMLTDYLDGATAVVESGTWLRDGDVILVVITGTASEVYDEATEFTVETQEDGSILASSPEVFGSRGLLLTLRSTQ